MKDTGSYNVVMPVVRLLQQEHPDWQWSFFATSVAATKLRSAGIEFSCQPRDFDPWQHHAVISGTSSTEDGFRLESTICELAEGITPIILVSDLWLTSGRMTTFAPTTVTVLDELSRTMTARIHRHSNVVVTGSPAFDVLVNIDHAAERSRLREQLGVADTDRLIYFVSGYGDQSADIFTLLTEALNQLNNPSLVLAPRLHPKVMVDPAVAADKAKLEAAFATFRGRRVDVQSFPSGEALLPAADLVVSNFSTLQLQAVHYAALNGSPLTLHVILPEDRKLGRRILFHDLLDVPPAITLGAAEAAFLPDASLLADTISAMFIDNERERWLAACRQHFPLDGKATRRVADAVLEMIR